MVIGHRDDRDGDPRQRQRDAKNDEPQSQAIPLSPEKYLPASPPPTLVA